MTVFYPSTKSYNWHEAPNYKPLAEIIMSVPNWQLDPKAKTSSFNVTIEVSKVQFYLIKIFNNAAQSHNLLSAKSIIKSVFYECT